MAPNRSQVAFQRGLCHLQAGTPKRAIPDFDAVLQHDRDNCEALFYRACALSCEKSWDRAVDDLTRVIKLHPKDWRALGARSYAYSQLGKPVESRADREEAVRLEANEHQKGTEGGGLP